MVVPSNKTLSRGVQFRIRNVKVTPLLRTTTLTDLIPLVLSSVGFVFESKYVAQRLRISENKNNILN